MRVLFQEVVCQGCSILSGVSISMRFVAFGQDKKSFYGIFSLQRPDCEEKKVETQVFDIADLVDELAAFQLLSKEAWRQKMVTHGMPIGTDHYLAYLLHEIKKKQSLCLRCELHNEQLAEFDFYTKMGDSIIMHGRSREVSDFFQSNTSLEAKAA